MKGHLSTDDASRQTAGRWVPRGRIVKLGIGPGVFALALCLLVLGPARGTHLPADPPLPQHLRDTGLFGTDGVTPADDHIAYTPQYTLWSDGATKRRWLSLPRGTTIDASQPDAWNFPRGTRLWKEFSVDGRRVETRYIERSLDGGWRYGTYAWAPDGHDATLVAAQGAEVTLPSGARYAFPSQDDCRACHEGTEVPVLGFSALQLSPDRDTGAVRNEASPVDVRSLVARGVLRNPPDALLTSPPRIAARSPLERAALGYLHGNCAQCHNGSDAGVPVGLDLQQHAASSAPSDLRALFAPSRFRMTGAPQAVRWIEPGRPEDSVLLLRMRSRDPQRQMPPLGTRHADALGVALIEQWISTLPPITESNND